MSASVDQPGPPSDPTAIDLDDPVVRLIPPLAGLGLVALATGRVLAPALESVSVGMGSLVGGLQRFGAVASQVFAFAAMMIAIVTILAVSRSRLPLALRLAALTLGGFAVLPTVWALHEQVTDVAAALVGASASLLALAAAPVLMRAPFARAPGLVIGLVAVGGLLRLGAVKVALAALAPGGGALVTAARSVATAALLCDTVAIAVALVWTAWSAREANRARLTSPGTLLILAVALLLTRQALAGLVPEAHGLDLLCWRAASRLVNRPEAALPLGFRVFIGFLAPLTAVAALFARGAVAPLGAAVALALCARGAVEMPPSALMLVIGALGAALTARDGRALWASLALVPGPRPPATARGPADRTCRWGSPSTVVSSEVKPTSVDGLWSVAPAAGDDVTRKKLASC